MNNRIKRIIAITLTIGALSSIEPTKYMIMNKMTHASESEDTSVYLKTLSLNKSDIDFSKDTFYYDVKVDRDVNEIKVTAKPKSSDASVTIDDYDVDKNDNYKKIIDIEQGNNIVKIKVTNNEEEKIYTLNILCGEAQQDNIYLNNINLGNGNINFSQEKDNYDVTVKESVSKIIIGAIPEQDMHEVMIDGAKGTEEHDYKQTVDLNKGKNPIIIKVTNKNNKQRIYTLNITRENSLDTKETQDDIYLDYIKVDDITINTDEKRTVYELNLNEKTDLVEIKAHPELSIKYNIKINDKIVEKVDDYKNKFNLKLGKNIIIIKVQDESTNKQRVYTLNINRGAVTNTSSTNEDATTKSTDNNSAVKHNQWIQVNNKWKYNDAAGNSLKNTWFYDNKSEKNYYLQYDGNMATGWLNNNDRWYYLDISGARQSGWRYVNDQWYYLDSNGIMQTGWIRELTGKYYHLNSNGAMDKNKTIDGFKLGNDGAWVK